MASERDLVGVDALADHADDAPRLELPGHGARAGEAAAGLGEHRAHVRGGPVAVVGGRLHEQRDTAGAVALVHDLLVLLGLVAAARLVDGALDDLRGHVGRARLVQRQPEAVVGVGVGSAGSHRDADLARDLGEDRAALGVVGALLALDLGPLGMSGHRRRVYMMERTSRSGPGSPSARGPQLRSASPGGRRVPHDERSRLRNAVLAGHAGSGKTSLAEHLLHTTGAIARAGRVDDGTASLDWEPEEQKRKLSLSLGVATFTPRGAPHHHHRHARLRRLRGRGRSRASRRPIRRSSRWMRRRPRRAPTRPSASGAPWAGRRCSPSPAATARTPTRWPPSTRCGPSSATRSRPSRWPSARASRSGAPSTSCTAGRGCTRTASATRCPSRTSWWPRSRTRRDQLLEAAAEADDDVLDKYLEGKEVSDAELEACLHKGVRESILAPVLLTSATRDIGIEELLDVDRPVPALPRGGRTHHGPRRRRR